MVQRDAPTKRRSVWIRWGMMGEMGGEEETGLIAQLTGLFGVYAGFDDPRVRTVLILYTGVATGGELRAGDDAIELAWYALDALPDDLAFASHRQALAEMVERLARA